MVYFSKMVWDKILINSSNYLPLAKKQEMLLQGDSFLKRSFEWTGKMLTDYLKWWLCIGQIWISKHNEFNWQQEIATLEIMQ